MIRERWKLEKNPSDSLKGQKSRAEQPFRKEASPNSLHYVSKLYELNWKENISDSMFSEGSIVKNQSVQIQL